jgi:hypothetical protein
MKLYRNYTELRRLFRGVRTLQAHCTTPDHVPLSISLLRAPGAEVAEGEVMNYELVLANSTGEHQWAKVVVDIYNKKDPSHPNGHFGYFSKRIFLRARQAQKVAMVFNWSEAAWFAIDGVNLAPDGIWIGSCRKSGIYWFKALLFAADNQPAEELVLAQNFRPRI